MGAAVMGPWGPRRSERPAHDLEKARKRWSRRVADMDKGQGPFGLHPTEGPSPAEDAAVALRRDPAAPGRMDGLKRTDFFAAMRDNRRKTVWLCAVLILIGALLGYVIGWAAGVVMADELDPQAWNAAVSPLSVPAFWGGGIMLAVSLVWTAIALSFGDSMVVAMAGAKFVTREQEPVLYNVVEEMAIAAGLPAPRVAVIETPALNAFATGLKPEKAVIGVTRGLLDKLNRAELQGVVGHEMGHIANNDILYATAVGVMVGLIVLVSDITLRSLRHIRLGGGRGKGGGALALILVLVLVVAAILAPIGAMLVQFAVSRQREYLADATSVQFTRNPHGLIGALRKIADSSEKFEDKERAIQHLFIANPEHSFTEESSSLWATHPHPKLRIKRLRELG